MCCAWPFFLRWSWQRWTSRARLRDLADAGLQNFALSSFNRNSENDSSCVSLESFLEGVDLGHIKQIPLRSRLPRRQWCDLFFCEIVSLGTNGWSAWLMQSFIRWLGAFTFHHWITFFSLKEQKVFSLPEVIFRDEAKGFVTLTSSAWWLSLESDGSRRGVPWVRLCDGTDKSATNWRRVRRTGLVKLTFSDRQTER